MIAKKVFSQLAKKGFTIAFAESMTGGSLTYELIKNPGSSVVIKGSIVAYSIEQKIKLLNLDPVMIYSCGIVSSEVATEMAKNIQKMMDTDVAIGVTGNAGPTTQETSNSLEAYVTIILQKDVHVLHIDLSELTRIEAIKKTVLNTYEFMEKLLQKIG
ncbi:MAG: CinA family protein [Acholeplasmataceae bacterium]|jgi:PncC family amidohydrolase|nr:CinA family protein [Acholeplasmataceae bacterium]